MAGELWREQLQIGKEVTAGTGVAATRIMYVGGLSFTRARNPIPHKFATGTRDNVRSFTQGPVMAGGQLKVPVSADELIEWFLLGIQGGVTPTTPVGATNARLWTFKPGLTLDSATLERNDGANNFQLLGVRANKITIAGSVGGTNDCTVDLFAQERNDAFGALTGALASRTPSLMEGWQTRLWVSAIGGGIGGASATAILLPPCMINWSVSFDGGLGRKYVAANTLAAYSVTLGELTITASLQLEASVAATLTELTNWSNTTGRQLTLEFLGPTDEIEAGANEVQTLSSTATGGSFKLIFAGQTTTAITASATLPTAAAVQAALLALPNVTTQSGLSNVLVTGGPIPTPIVITFQNDLGKQDVPLITVDNALATGGTATIAATTPGRSGRRSLSIDLPGFWTTPDVNQSDANTRTYSFPYQYQYDPTLAAGIQIRAQNARTVAYSP